jgi:hypothetical protein
MATVDELLVEMKANPQSVRFSDACKVATHFFGKERINGSHHIWSMKWAGDPRVNLQDKGDVAKPYQVKQLLLAVEKEKQRLETEAKKGEATPPEKAKPKGKKKARKR